MTQDADLWVIAPGAWVLLTELPATIERELGVPRTEAIRALRNPMETGFVHAHVVGWSDPSRKFEDWVWTNRIDDLERISVEGWLHVNWHEGTLAGHPIRVSWDNVRQELATLAAKARRESKEANVPTCKGSQAPAAIPSRGGGAPPRHDWESFWIEVALYAAKNDLEAEHRRELQSHMRDWTAREWADPPDPATVRARLARLFKSLGARSS